ncbi:alpha-2-macroglobulin receptor-associated protein [Bombina bombina]|uniref:alpha-2-macroglobulin receptor-associated protein n=1 Tax=Bombina bombina TaxID=8345 RepID=UPI00235A9940|nr:alpha-2-macroglobulin receptor-associated protein [Bombina bombina]
MSPHLFLLLLCSWLLFGAQAGNGGGKYTREMNENRSDREGTEFRIMKLNQIWEKAQRLQLSAVKLAELHSDLKIQEKDELNWKKLKAEGLDNDGEREAKLRRSLNVIMATYGLDGKKKSEPEESNYIKEGTENDVLNDPRLEKLWNKAKSSGKFSEEELEKLWREFIHHKEKTHEYNILLDTLSRTEEIHKNVISPDEEEVKPEFLHDKHSDLKDKLRSINHGFERLRKVSHEGYDSERDFNEPRVNDLWDMAKKANFSDNELDSFKDELKHFETKIEKHQHYQKQLEVSHEKLKHIAETGDKEHLQKSKEKNQKLTEKIKELGYKVKKHLQDLTNRVSRNGLEHNEL